MKEDKKHYIAVYGSLRRNEGNYAGFLAGSKYMGRAYIRAKLYDLGPFPCCVVDEHSLTTVEVFEVDNDTLAAIRMLEGCPSHYQEKTVDAFAILPRDGRNVAHKMPVKAYFYDRAPEGYPEVASGCWVSYKALLQNRRQVAA